MPSRPRLIRPLFSVMHSPRLTNRNGVLTPDRPAEHGQRHAPPPELAHGRRRGRARTAGMPPVERLAREDHQEHDALEHEHGGVGQVEPALEHAAARRDAAEQQRDRHDRQRMVARDERDQDAGVAVARDERRVRAAVHRGHLDHAGQPRGGAAEHARDQHERADRQPGQPRRARVAADDPRARSPNVVRATSTYIDQAGQHAAAQGPSARRGRAAGRACSRRRSARWTACSGSPDRAAALPPSG